MDAQQQHDAAVAGRTAKLEAGSKQRLHPLLAKKSESSSKPAQSTGFDPIASAMRDHPTLTEEKARELAERLGF